MVSAQAADLSLDSLKDAKDVVPDGPITWHGVTFYGTIDVGYAYSTNGLPASGAFYPGTNYTIYGAKYAQGSLSTLTNNALSQSNVGLKIEENIGYGFQGIGKLDTGFNPISGELADACASVYALTAVLLTTATQPRTTKGMSMVMAAVAARLSTTRPTAVSAARFMVP